MRMAGLNYQIFLTVNYKMTSIAREIRAKKVSSTDPEYLERLAQHYDTPLKPIEDWLFEVENFGLRYERLVSDIGNNPTEVLKWIKQAYEIGYEYGKFNNVQTGKN